MTEVLIDLLSDVSHRFQQHLRDGVHTAGVDLTPFEARALVTIARMPGANQQVVAARMGCDKAQLTRSIKVLETRSLIARTTSTEDWRARDLTLTPEGQAIFTDLQALRAAIARDCFANVSAEDREKLASILTAMVDSLTSRSIAQANLATQSKRNDDD